jgi:transposase-like protein
MEELARRNGVYSNTIRLWRSKYAGMSASGYQQQPWSPTEGNPAEGLQSRGKLCFDVIQNLLH